LIRKLLVRAPFLAAAALCSFTFAACAGGAGGVSGAGVAPVAGPNATLASAADVAPRTGRHPAMTCGTTAVPAPVTISEGFAARSFRSGGSDSLIVTLTAPSSDCNIKVFTPISFYLALPSAPSGGLFATGGPGGMSTPAGSNSCGGTAVTTAGYWNYIMVTGASLRLGSSCSMSFFVMSVISVSPYYPLTVTIPAGSIASPDISSTNATWATVDVMATPHPAPGSP
jgi:hypothetical protein